MRTLLLSAILYLTGVAVVLYARPKLMFFPDGRWKEFGTGAADHTIFPFWLFCVLWGVLSYLIVVLLVDEPETTAIASLSTASIAATQRLQETEPPEDLLMPLPPKSKGRNATRVASTVAQAEEGNLKPGYYVLDPKGSRNSGVPKYIYIGAEAPGPGGSVGAGTDTEDE